MRAMSQSLEASALSDAQRVDRAVEMVSAIGAPRVFIEWDLAPASALAFLERVPSRVGICYDLGNERTRKNGQVGHLKVLAPHIVYCHLKHRAWGSPVTEHFPDDEKTRAWYRTRLELLRQLGFDGPVILETPVADSLDAVKRDLEIARWCLGGD